MDDKNAKVFVAHSDLIICELMNNARKGHARDTYEIELLRDFENLLRCANVNIVHSLDTRVADGFATILEI